MKLVTFDDGGRPRAGVLVADGAGEAIVDLSAIGDLASAGVLGIIERQDEALPAIREALKRDLPRRAVASTTLLAPIPRPPSMRDGYAFRQHVETARKNRGLEMIPEFDQFPVFYFTNHQAVVGPGDVRVMPRQLEKLDFELEAAIVVGRRGRNVPASEADQYVFGLTIMNDLSARVLQMDEMKLSLGPAKGKDFATALGPYLLTLDELEDKAKPGPNGNSYDLRMQASVNGVKVSDGNLADMSWTFAQILERVSYGADIFPGDVIGSGTVGTGCFLELNGSGITKNQWLRPGDVVRLEIERLGVLQNTIVAE